MNNPAANQDALLEQELAGLKKEYERLKMDQVRTEQNLENLSHQLAELEKKAVEQYGTADAAELEKLLAEKRAENARLVEEYRRHIQSIHTDLAAIENGGNGGQG